MLECVEKFQATLIHFFFDASPKFFLPIITHAKKFLQRRFTAMNVLVDIMLAALVLYFIFAVRRSMRMSNAAVALIKKYERDKKNPKLIEEIFAALNSDVLLSRILKQHKATVKDISKLHAKLMKWGDFRKYNRYIPITSFFNVSTLEYLLSHKDDDAKSLTEKMMNHFHF